MKKKKKKGSTVDVSAAILIRKVRDALQTRLQPEYVNVVDISSWFLQRKLLGAKRFWHQGIKYDPVSRKWTVSIFETPWRKAYAETIQLQGVHALKRMGRDINIPPTIVGMYESEERAVRACQQAIRLRNLKNPLEIADAKVPLLSHYRIVIISQVFRRKTQQERLDIVFEILLDALNLRFQPDQINGVAHIRTLGSNTTHLPCFRFLNTTFLVEARTPAQWNPSEYEVSTTERLGQSHITPTVLSIASQSCVSTDTLLKVVEHGQACADGTKKNSSSSSAFSHFYHGLPNEIKEMIKTDSSSTLSPSSKLHKNTEDQIGPKFGKQRRKYLRAVQMLQRVYRSRGQFRTVRRIVRHHRSALEIQRIYRGYLDRMYAQEYKKIVNIAAMYIQAVYRSHVSREKTKAMKKEMINACLKIQPLIRGYLSRKFAEWIKYNHDNGVKIQRVFRGYLGRKRVKMKRQIDYRVKILIPAATSIQRQWICHRARVHFKQLMKQHYHDTVVVPSAIEIQRVYRGYLGRLKVDYQRLLNKAARKLQLCWKAYLRGKWRELIMIAQRKTRSATRIQSIGRGYLARKFFKRRLKKWRFIHIITPAAVRLQSLYRGYRGRIYAREFSHQTDAADTIKNLWRNYNKILQEKHMWEDLQREFRASKATVIQNSFRYYLANKKVSAMILSRRGREIKACIVLQAAWRGYYQRVRVNELRKMLRIEIFARTLSQYNEEGEMIQFDSIDAGNDLKHVMKTLGKNDKAIKALKKQCLEWEHRLPEIEKELASMDVEDEERGWTEAFETEKEVVFFSFGLGKEDILGHKMRKKNLLERQEELEIELEDLDTDFDENMSREINTLEELRLLELNRGKEMHQLDQAQKKRKQINRWRVKSTRKKVIRKQRTDLKALRSVAELEHRNDSLGTISLAKSRARKYAIQNDVKKALKKERVEQVKDLSAKSNDIRSMYDSIVSKTKTIVNDLTHGVRVTKSDIRADRKAMCWECGAIYCTCGNQEQDSTTSKKVHRRTRTSRRKKHHNS